MFNIRYSLFKLVLILISPAKTLDFKTPATIDRFLNGANVSMRFNRAPASPKETLHPSGAVSLMGETTGHINAWGDDWRATAPPQDPSAFL